MGALSTVVLGLTLLMAPAAAQTAPSRTPAWEMVASLGRIKTVYVEPARIKDKALLASAVQEILDKAGRDAPVEIDFFDDRVQTPRTLPFPPSTRAHHRAKFNWNPANGMKKFVWVQPADPNQPASRPKYTEDPIEVH